MPDEGKLSALEAAGYKVVHACGTCEHFSGGGGNPWGLCHRIPHEHAKHGRRDATGVLRYGTCPGWALSPGWPTELRRSGHDRFADLPADAGI